MVGGVSAYGVDRDAYAKDTLTLKNVVGCGDFDNVKRFSVEDYRHGYTYRVSEEYEKKYDNKNWRKEDLGWKKDYYRRSKKDWNKDSYYKWSSQLSEYEKFDCYHSAPSGKLFYRKCA